MEGPLQRIAALASTLKEAELRTLIELTRRANSHQQCRLSSRQIAESAGISRKNAQRAIDSLTDRGLITSDGGSATRAATYKMLFLEVEVLPVRGVTATPPEGNMWLLSDATPGVDLTPPPASEERHLGRHPDATANKEHTPAHGVDGFAEIDRALDRLRKAKPTLYEPKQFQEARRWLHGCMAKFGAMPDPHPPDDMVVAQFLAIAEWPRLLGMIYDLMAEPETRKTKPQKYGWFIVVAMQRMWGLSPQQQRQAREKLQLIKQHERTEAAELQSAIAAVATSKRMR